MDIKVLGTRGEIEPSAPYHSHHSGVLIDGKFLFDLGEKEFLDENPEQIFITHLHPDHAYFVRGEEIETDLPIFAPEKHENCLSLKVFESENTKGFGSYKITSIPTHHSLKVESQAYKIESADKKILYTGDMIWINKDYHNLLQDLDLVITEGSFIKKDGMIRRDDESGKIYGHNGIPDLIDLFKDFTDHILLVHFGSWFYKDIQQARKKLQNLAKQQDVKITVGYDGLKLKV